MGAVRTHSHVAMMMTTTMILEGNPSRYRAIYPAILGQSYLQQQLCFKQVDGLINLMTSFYSSFLTSIFVRWGFPRSFEKKKKKKKKRRIHSALAASIFTFFILSVATGYMYLGLLE